MRKVLRNMRQFIVVPLLVLSCAASAGAQTWRQLYDRGQYEKAAALLHPLVLNALQADGLPSPDPAATEALAQLYLRGTGVVQDRILGCSFAMLASNAAHTRYGSDLRPAVMRLEGLQARACAPLSADDRLEAARMMGCPKFGPERQVFGLAADHSVEVSRRGIRVESQGKEASRDAEDRCLERFAPARYTRVDAPNADGGLAPRHMIEVFRWVPAPAGNRALMWELLEIAGVTIDVRAAGQIAQEPGFPWMTLAAPSGFAGAAFEMTATGEVRWRFADSTLAGVLPPLPAGPPPLAPPLPTTGSAHVDVTVVDRHGAALAGATVALAGVVSREATTNEVGAVAFDDLPDGRYDIVASKKGLASSPTRVVDLAGPEGATVALTLKPYGRTTTSNVCGGFDATTLASLAKGAAMAIHVTVVDQHTIEVRPETGAEAEIRTYSDVRTLQVFLLGADAASAEPLKMIAQGGGRMDRGDVVDLSHANALPPLNVGDEYVIFMTRTSDGAWWIEGLEEGVFRIRNGRVEPLGQGGAATTWKGRAAARFFQELNRMAAAK